MSAAATFLRYGRQFDGTHPGARPRGRHVFRRWYDRYLLSRAWRARRAAALDRDGHRCVECGAPAEQVHHTTYRRVGFERLADLKSLCGRCHEAVHEVTR